jgi:hypothetical protein
MPEVGNELCQCLAQVRCEVDLGLEGMRLEESRGPLTLPISAPMPSSVRDSDRLDVLVRCVDGNDSQPRV